MHHDDRSSLGSSGVGRSRVYRSPVQHYAVGVFLLWISLTNLIGCTADRPLPSEDAEQRLYEKAIKDAAVRGPGWDTPLWPLPEGSLSVSTFTEDATLDTQTLNIWVASTQELWQKCQGKSEPILALQQLLGLPPQKKPQVGDHWHLLVFEAESHDLFRPCPGGLDSGAPANRPQCRLASNLDPQLNQEFTQFLLQQWWFSHRSTVEPGHDPEIGFPWTGMGWTYDWDPTSTSHRGVSEFVVKRGAVLRHIQDLNPATFCHSSAPPSS